MNSLIIKLQKSLFIALLAVVSACSQPVEKIIIISTNDMHAAIDRFANLATLVEQYRAVDSTNLLLVDAGDRWTGNPYVDLAEQRCRPIIELMNELGYDFGTMGNHEFDHGVGLLTQRLGEARFEKVLTNIAVNESGLPHMAPYTFRTIAGIRLGFIGLVTTAVDGHPEGKLENFGGATFTDATECSASLVSLRDSCDLLVALSHIGYDADSVLALTQHQYDLIIGGHSHTVLPEGGVKVGNTLITQTGKGLKYAGVTTITTRGGKIMGIENKLVLLDTIAPSPRFAQMVAEYKNNPVLKESVGETSVGMDKTALLNMMSDIMLEGTGAEIALFNLGSVRLDSLPRGVITVADVYAIEPFGNSPYIVKMTLDEIKTMILNKFNSTGKESHKMDIYPAGVSYQIVTDAEGTGTDVFFKPLTAPSQKEFKVAMSDYVYSTYKFDKQGYGTPTGLMITDLMTEYLGKHSPINVSKASRVEIK